MTSIKINIRLKPVSRKNQVRLVQVKEPQSGGHATVCECGNNFAAFASEQAPEYTAFTNAIGQCALQSMASAGIVRPSAGSVRLTIKVCIARPLSHYDSNDAIRGDSDGLSPMTNPAFFRVIESISIGLKGNAYLDHKQVVSCNFGKAYREHNSIEIEVQQIRAVDIDSSIKQMELF